MVNLYNVILSHTAPPPTIGYDTSTGRDFFLMEGESIQLCVVLLSGSIPSEFIFEVRIDRNFEQSRGKQWLLFQLHVHVLTVCFGHSVMRERLGNFRC